MTKIASKIFDAMTEMAEVRHVYQRIDPKFGLTPEQKRTALKHVARAKKAIAVVERAFKQRPKAKKKKPKRKA